MKFNVKLKSLIFVFLVISCQSKQNYLSLNNLFTHKMVLQRNSTVPIWGKSRPNEEIDVKCSWGYSSNILSDSLGNWDSNLETPDAGGPFSIKVISDTEVVVIEDVLIGEVWLAAGQSNMEMDFNYCCNTTDSSEYELNNANYPKIRMFNVKKEYLLNPTVDIDGLWTKAEGDKIENFSAVAYFFAKKLHKELKIPIGIIHSSWGGSDIESWISKEKLLNIDGFKNKITFTANQKSQFKKSIDWFSNFESIAMPSSGFDLMLGSYTDKIDSNMNYSDFFISDWRALNLYDQVYIDEQDNFENWNKIKLPGSIKNILPSNDFQGVVILKKKFMCKESKINYKLKFDEISLGWAGELREYDIYINGKKLISTFGNKEDNNYYDKLGKDFKKQYSTYPFKLETSIPISKDKLKLGKNEIAIRFYGSGEIGEILLIGEDSLINLNGEWSYRLSAEVFKQLNEYKYPYQNYFLYNKPDIDFSKRPPINSFGFSTPRSIYNGMIHPLIPYKIKGAIWYQGENNAFRHSEYGELFKVLIEDWRDKWGMDFPFYYVQIAPYFNYYGTNSSLREVQRNTLKIPKTGMVVTLDIGENYDIHPSNKHAVSYRLASLALNNDYGYLGISSGPLFKKAEIEKDKIIVTFDYVGSGLSIRQNLRNEFEIASLNKKYFKADIKIIGETIVASSYQVQKPQFVRYGWDDTSKATLFNLEGYPASSFTSE